MKYKLIPNKIFTKRALKIMFAIIGSQILLSSVGFLDNFMTAGYGDSKQLDYAAVGIGAETWFIFQAPMIAGTTVFGIFYSQYKSQKNNFSELAKINIYFGVISMIIISLIMFFFASNFINLFFIKDDYPIADSNKIKSIATDYIKILALGNIFASVGVYLINPVLMLGKGKYAIYAASVALIMNAVFNGALIYGAKLGGRGAAWATTISYIFELVIGCIAAYTYRRYFKFKTSIFKINKKILKSLTKRIYLFLSSIIMIITLAGTTIVLTITYGSKLMQGLSIAYAISGITFSILPAVRRSVGSIVGHELGEGNFEKAKQYSKYLIFISFFIGLVFALLGITIGYIVPPLFIDDSDIAYKASVSIYILAALCIPIILQTLFSACIEIAGKQLIPAIFNYFSPLWIQIPLIFICSYFVLDLSYTYMYFISTMSISFTAIPLYIVYRRKKWLVNLNHEVN